MMKERVLIVDDQRTDAQELRDTINEGRDGCTEVDCAYSYKEAVQKCSKGDLACAVVDLDIPESPGGAVRGSVTEGTRLLGFDLIEDICRHNPFTEIYIASCFADESAVTSVQNNLRFTYQSNFKWGWRIKGVFNKTADANELGRRVCQDLRGLTPLNEHLQRRGFFVLHPLERRIMRRLWDVALIEPDQWPTPVIMFRGSTGAGKSHWANEFPELVNFVRPNPQRVLPVSHDCGHLTGPEGGESPQIALFGCRSYAQKPACAGFFERATRYRRLPDGQLANSNSEVDYSASSTVVLHEFGNMPFDCQRMLLTVLDRLAGCVTPAGGGSGPIRIGCSIVFTTNADLETRVVESSKAEAGQLREDLFQRLVKDARNWIIVPSLRDLGWDTLLDHLQCQLARRAEREVIMAPSAESLLREYFERFGDSMSYRHLVDIADCFAANPQGRLRDEHVQTGVGGLLIRGMKGTSVTSPKNVATRIEAVINICGLQNPEHANSFLIRSALDVVNERPNPDPLGEYVYKKDIEERYHKDKRPFTWSRVRNLFGQSGQTALQPILCKITEHGYELRVETNGIVVRVRDGWCPPPREPRNIALSS